jgi:hypothetical protein
VLRGNNFVIVDVIVFYRIGIPIGMHSFGFPGSGSGVNTDPGLPAAKKLTKINKKFFSNFRNSFLPT